MSDATWKAFERRVARRFGTTRIPAASFGQRADRGLHAPDVDAGWFVAQLKKGYRFPAYLRTWLTGIRGAAGDRIGVVVWGEKGAKDDEAIVVLTLSDWCRVLARAPGSLPADAVVTWHTPEDTPS
jgi:hypothetical protein